MKTHPTWCVFVLSIFPTPPTHAEHEETSSMVSVHAWRLFLVHRRKPNMKRHQRWCLFVLGVFHTQLTHAEHEKTPALGLFVLSRPTAHPSLARNVRRRVPIPNTQPPSRFRAAEGFSRPHYTSLTRTARRRVLLTQRGTNTGAFSCSAPFQHPDN